MIHVIFILIYCVLAAVKLFKIDKFAFIRSQYTFHGFDAESKTEFANNSMDSPKTGKLF